MEVCRKLILCFLHICLPVGGGDFTRTERISNLVHYEVRYGPKTAFKFEMLLRSGYNDVTLLCWSLHPVPQSSLASEQAAALFEDAAFYATTAHIALFIGMFYMDQLRLLTLANLYRSRSLDQAIDRYFEINDHMQAEGRIRRRFFQMYEEESDRIDKLIATWREEAANADPHLIKGIGRPPELSALVDK